MKFRVHATLRVLKSFSKLGHLLTAIVHRTYLSGLVRRAQLLKWAIPFSVTERKACGLVEG